MNTQSNNNWVLQKYEMPDSITLAEKEFDNETWTLYLELSSDKKYKQFLVTQWVKEIQDFVFWKYYTNLEEAYLNYQLGIIKTKNNVKSE